MIHAIIGACRVESHHFGSNENVLRNHGPRFLGPGATTVILALSTTDPHDQPRSLLVPSEITCHTLSHGNTQRVIHPWSTALMQRHTGKSPIVSLTKSLRSTRYALSSYPPHVLSKFETTATTASLSSPTAVAACCLQAWFVPLLPTSTSLPHLR